MREIRVLVVDDFKDFRQWVYSKLKSESGFKIVDEAADGIQAIQKAQEVRPDLILLDVTLPHLSGIKAEREISRRAPFAKILFLSACGDSDIVSYALSNGAKGYVLKSDAGRELLPAAKAVVRGETFVSSGIKRTLREFPLEWTQAVFRQWEST